MFLDLKGKSESEKNTAKWGEEEEYRTCRTPGGGFRTSREGELPISLLSVVGNRQSPWLCCGEHGRG